VASRNATRRTRLHPAAELKVYMVAA